MQSTRRPLATTAATEKEKKRSGQRIASLAPNGKGSSANRMITSVAVSMTARKKENIGCAQSGRGGSNYDDDDDDDDDDLADARCFNGGDESGMGVREDGGGNGRVYVGPVTRENSPTKLPLPSAAARAGDKKVGTTRSDVSALGRRRRVGLSIGNGQAKNEDADRVSKRPDVRGAEGLKKVGDAKINAAAGRALLRRSSTRNSSYGNAVSNDVTKTGNSGRHSDRDGERLSRKSDNKFSTIRPSRVSSTSSRASCPDRRESAQQPITSAASSQTRRLSSRRQSSLGTSLGCRESLGGITSHAGTTLGACSRNVSSASTGSANDLDMLQRPNNKNPTRLRPNDDGLRQTGVQVMRSRTIPVRSLRQSRRSTSVALGANKQLIPTAGENHDNDNNNNSIQSSLEVIRLQTETLQLHRLHSLMVSNVRKKSIETDRSLRENVSSIEAAYKAMRSKEQAAQSLINRIAMQSWSYGADGDGSQADNIALLVTILDEFPALLGSDDEKCGEGYGSESGDAGDGEYHLYAHLIKEFESWMRHVQQVWQARGEHGIGPAVLSSTYSTAGHLTHGEPTSKHTKSQSNKSPYTITPMSTSWYTNLAALCHKLDILSRSMGELEPAPEGSTLALTLHQCTTFLANAKQELREMREMEELVFTLETRKLNLKGY